MNSEVEVKVTRNYQVTLPSIIRDKLGIEQGDYVVISIEANGKVTLRRKIPLKELKGVWDREMDEIMKQVKRTWSRWKRSIKSL